MHRILAEKSVNITELRKNPAKYFIDQPVAVPVSYTHLTLPTILLV